MIELNGMSAALVDMLKPDTKLILDFGENNINNAVFYVCAIIDNEQVVTRRWYKRRGWVYKIEHYYLYELYLNDGFLKVDNTPPPQT